MIKTCPTFSGRHSSQPCSHEDYLGAEDTRLLLGTQARLEARMKLRAGAVQCQRSQVENKFYLMLETYRESTVGQDEDYWQMQRMEAVEGPCR